MPDNKIYKDVDDNYYVNQAHSSYTTYVSTRNTEIIAWNEECELELGDKVEGSSFSETGYDAVLENVDMFFILQKRDELLLDDLSISYKVKKNANQDYDLLIPSSDVT